MNRATRILTIAGLAGALLAIPAAAQAAPGQYCGSITQVTGDNVGLLNGTQIAVPVNLDLNVTHNALGILGLASASGGDTSTFNCRVNTSVRHHRHHRHHH